MYWPFKIWKNDPKFLYKNCDRKLKKNLYNAITLISSNKIILVTFKQIDLTPVHP